MKNRSIISSLVVCSFLLVGCETKTQTGILAGGVAGAGAGALIGGGQGALIGGAVGVVGGALIGSALDAQDRRYMEEHHPRTLQHIDNGQQLTISDIKSLSQAGISDNKIIELIDKTHSRYNLSSKQVIELQKAGVSQRVINYMLNT
ncbi:MAG: hypothetical protein MRY21_00605 [Simkaniaceae bacterium]|nr:hypothetical protein [Simkaniaceae bacterium]